MIVHSDVLFLRLCGVLCMVGWDVNGGCSSEGLRLVMPPFTDMSKL